MSENQFPIIATFADLQSLCSNSIAEGLQVEFKVKEDPSSPTLSRTDKRNIAEAVSALANSDGGTLVLGVKTERQGNLDVASSLVPIAEVQQFETNFRMVCGLNISPGLAGVRVRTIKSAPKDKSGFLVCEVEPSDRRPHMSTAPGVHSYFRRSFDGNLPMSPSEVRDQILAVREATISPSVEMSRGASFSNVSDWVAIKFSINFGLENKGSRACLNPFLRVKSSQAAGSNNAHFDRRLGVWKRDVPYGTLVHVDDAIPMIALDFHARILRFDLHSNLVSAEDDLLKAVRVYPGSDDLHSTTIGDKLDVTELGFELSYGAENTTARSASASLTRSDIAARLLAQHDDSLRERFMAWGICWRSDLIANMRSNLSPIDIRM